MARHTPEQQTQNLRQDKREAGIALISVLFIVVVLTLLVSVFAMTVLSELVSTRNTTSLTRNKQMADAVSERARVTVIDAYKKSQKTVPNFLLAVRQQHDGGTVLVPAVHGTKSVKVGATTGHWRVSDVSDDDELYGWIEVSATMRDTNGVQTVMRRVGFGENNIFNFAMLSETTNCMYCHLRVNGDVGNLDFFRPGWGSEGVRGQGSGGSDGGSVINGSAYSAKAISNDQTNISGSNKTVNGAKFTKQVYANYDNQDKMLPVGADGQPAFPPIERAVAQANAQGSIGGGLIYAIDANRQTRIVAGVSSVQDGNLVLIGTAANPIVLNRDVYVTGDVVIKGVVKGQGAIYAGRNMYFAGNVTTQNPPSKPGVGVCAGVSDPDICAKKNIGAKKDSFRAAARGNIVMGDYTEKNADGSQRPWDRRQSADFYRNQFGFDDASKMRYYEKGTGDELTYNATKGGYYNTEGAPVASSNVKSVNAVSAYDYSFKPGTVAADGTFKPWLTDADYRDLVLGEESYDYNTWRYQTPRTGSGSLTEAQIRDELLKARIPTAAATTLAKQYKESNKNNGKRLTFSENVNYLVPGCTKIPCRISGTAYITHEDGDTSSIRVIIDNGQNWDTQVTKVDAFLYANKRIAGKTSMKALAINGGLVAREIGILAPGRRTSTWWTGTDQRYRDLENASKACGSSTEHYNADAQDCAFTINYDYRMRNGGYPYNLVAGVIGSTVSWQLADEKREQVSP